MRVFKWLLTYKLYYLLYSIYSYVKDYQLIADTFYSKEFIAVLKKYLGVNVKKDWIGRLYCVVNPNININGNFDISNNIIELDGNNSNNNEYVKAWVIRQLDMIGTLFKIQKLYDYISINFRHVGPVNADNYLVILDMPARKELAYAFKTFLFQTFIYGIIVIGVLFYIGIF